MFLSVFILLVSVVNAKGESWDYAICNKILFFKNVALY